MSIVQVQTPSIPEGKYLIKNRGADIYWSASEPWDRWEVFFDYLTPKIADLKTKYKIMQWDITQDTNSNIFIKLSSTVPFKYTDLADSRRRWWRRPEWVGVELIGSMVPASWQLIEADGNFFYLTTDMNRGSQNPRVPMARQLEVGENGFGEMATLKKGDQRQMWEFIRV